MYQMQLDPEANRLAVTIPRSAEAFDAHWADALHDPSITAKAILLGGVLAGYISCFQRNGRANVGYWSSREHWGKGIATQAPAAAPAQNRNPSVARSRGDKQRCPLTPGAPEVRVRRRGEVQVSPASDRFPECEEAVRVLRE